MQYARLTALALTAAALAASGCGSSKSSGPLTPAAFVAKADTVCYNANAAMDKSRTLDLRRYLAFMANNRKAEFAELAKIVPPASLQADWKLMLADGSEFTADVTHLEQLVASNNLNSAKPLFSSAGELQNRLRATAQRIGFNACAMTSIHRTR